MFFVLIQIGLDKKTIQPKNVKTSSHLNYLNSLTNIYQETKRVKFSSGVVLMRLSDYPKVLLDMITADADPRALSTTLLNAYLR